MTSGSCGLTSRSQSSFPPDRPLERVTHEVLDLAHELGPKEVELEAWVDDEGNSERADQWMRGVVRLSVAPQTQLISATVRFSMGERRTDHAGFRSTEDGLVALALEVLEQPSQSSGHSVDLWQEVLCERPTPDVISKTRLKRGTRRTTHLLRWRL